MKKSIRFISATFLIVAVFTFSAVAQGGLKVRVAVNSGMFLSEPNSSDAIVDPLAALFPGGTTDFSPEVKIGVEAEVSIPVGSYFGLGVEFEDAKFSGANEDPAYYNYFASYASPAMDYGQEPLIYNTAVTNLLGNIRIYPAGHSTFTPFLKLYGGVAFIGTDLRYQSPEDQTEKTDPLYSRGTRLSVIEPTKFTAPHFGGGAGFEYLISGNISLYADLTVSYLDSDIIDGVPNFTFDQTLGYSVYHDVSSITGQVSIGLCYTLGDTGSERGRRPGRSAGGRTDSALPFFRRK